MERPILMWQKLNKSVVYRMNEQADRINLESGLKGRLSPVAFVICYKHKAGMVVFGVDNLNEINADLTVRGFSNWARKSIFKHFFKLLFGNLKLSRASAYIHPSNRKSVKLCRQLGFKRECAYRGTQFDQYYLLSKNTRFKWDS